MRASPSHLTKIFNCLKSNSCIKKLKLNGTSLSDDTLPLINDFVTGKRHLITVIPDGYNGLSSKSIPLIKSIIDSTTTAFDATSRFLLGSSIPSETKEELKNSLDNSIALNICRVATNKTTILRLFDRQIDDEKTKMISETIKEVNEGILKCLE